MHAPVLVTAPAALPVTLAQANAHLRLDEGDEDEGVSGMIQAATSYLDGWSGILGRCLVTQTWRQDFDWFEICLRLPLFPVASITSVKYVDTSDVEQTISSSNYALRKDARGAYVEFDADYSFPSLTDENGPRLNVTYVAGDAVASVPAALKHTILLLVAHWFRNREAVNVGNITTELEFTVKALTAPFRRVKF